MTPAAGKAATLETFLSLRKALSVCDEDLSRPDPSTAGSSWGWGRRSTSWGRRKRADGPFDPDAAALVIHFYLFFAFFAIVIHCEYVMVFNMYACVYLLKCM